MIEDILKNSKEKLVQRKADANKGSFGRLLIIAGSRGMAGAAYLSGLSAFKTGIGMVRYFGPEDNRVILQTLLPEAMYESFPGYDSGESLKTKLLEALSWADCVIVGPGLSKNDEVIELMEILFEAEVTEELKNKKAVIIDADALNIIALKKLPLISLSGPKTIITPHVAEMARLMGLMEKELKISHIAADKESCALEFAESFHINVVLKDHVTCAVVRNPENSALEKKSGVCLETGPSDIPTEYSSFMIGSGSSAMAKAGSGDVLCGFIAGVSAIFEWELNVSVPAAIYLHGIAGGIAAEKNGIHGILAGDIALNAPEAFDKAYKVL